MDILPQTETDATSTASYWGVIPAPVRYCKSLQPAAKLLFTEITALCRREGYCWASNAHFQSLYGVDRSTVQRWLVSLQKAGFVRVELVPGTGIRRIYDLTAPPEQKRGGGVSKAREPRRKTAIPPPQNIGTQWYNELEEEKEKESDARAGARAAGRQQAQEGKVTASPSTVKSNSEKVPSASKLRNVERVVALVRDVKARPMLERLWDAVQASGHPDAWAKSVDRLKNDPGASGGVSSELIDLFVFYCCADAELVGYD